MVLREEGKRNKSVPRSISPIKLHSLRSKMSAGRMDRFVAAVEVEEGV